MEQILLGDFPKSEKLDQFSKEEIISKYSFLETQYLQAIKEISRLKNKNLTDEQLNFILTEQLADFQSTLYGASSERYKKPEDKKENLPPKPQIKQPSERYPNIPVSDLPPKKWTHKLCDEGCC